MVGEHSICTEGVAVRHAGADRRENVGVSNRNAGEKPAPRKSKVSVAMSIIHGLVDPKAMEKSVVDGKQINISARTKVCDVVTEEKRMCALMVWRRWC